jgi:hypothetical protein
MPSARPLEDQEMEPTAGPPGPGQVPPDPAYGGHTRPPTGDPVAADAQSSEVTGRLPRRVRQRNMAPQLRRNPEPGPAAPVQGRDAGPVVDDEEPVPEVRRDLMASLQSGWLRGRDADDEPDDRDPRDEWGQG